MILNVPQVQDYVEFFFVGPNCDTGHPSNRSLDYFAGWVQGIICNISRDENMITVLGTDGEIYEVNYNFNHLDVDSLKTNFKVLQRGVSSEEVD